LLISLFGKSKLVVSIVALSFLSLSHGQQSPSDTLDITSLEQIVLTATRTARHLSSLPIAADIVTAEEIKKTNSVRLSDLLSEQTGLITIPDFDGGEGIQLQGMDSQYILILIDGVPLVGRKAGTLDIGRITTGNIKQIEIIKGASSSLYGSDALGGVINIITQTHESGFQASVEHRIASFNNQNSTSNINFKKNRLGVDLFFNRFSSDGYDLIPDDGAQTIEPFLNHTGTVRFTYDFSKMLKASAYGRIYDEQQYLPAALTLQYTDVIQVDTLKEYNFNLKVDWKLNPKWKTEFDLYATRYTLNSPLDSHDGSSITGGDFDQRLIRPEVRAIFTPNKRNTLMAGIGYNQETVVREAFVENPEFDSQYFYLQHDSYLFEGFNVIAGFRYDTHSLYNSQLSPKLAMRYQLTDELAIKGSVGYGFKAPDFRQLYLNYSNRTIGYSVIGVSGVKDRLNQLVTQGQLTTDSAGRINQIIEEFSEPLGAENSVAYNLGLSYRPSSSFKVSLNLFRNDINDLIETLPIARLTNGQNVFSYKNLDQVFTQGVEGNFKWSLFDGISIQGGYQLLYTADKSAEEKFESGEIFAKESVFSSAIKLSKNDYRGLFNRSRHMANFKIFYNVPSLNFDTNLRATYRSKYALFDTNSNNYLDRFDDFATGYFIWEFAMNKVFFKKYKFGVGVENIFDYTDSLNATNIAGRIVYAQINFTL